MRRRVAVWLADLIHRARWRILIAALGASLLSIPVVSSLTFEENLLDLLPTKSQVVRQFSLFMKHFSVEDSLVVLLQCRDPDRLLSYVEAFADRLRAYPLLMSIQYRTDLFVKGGDPYRFLFNILDEGELDEVLKKLSRAGLERSIVSLKTLLLAPALPMDRRILTMDPLGLLPLLAKHTNSQGLPVDPASGYYLSEDRTALLMILRPAGSSYEISFTEKLLTDLQEIQDSLHHEMGEGPEVEISYTGSYVYAMSFARWLRLDFTILSIISLAGLLVLFYLFFRGILVLLTIFVSLTAGILWTLALAGLILGYLNMISIAFSAIVLGLGIDIAIHFYARFTEEMRHQEIRRALEETFSHSGRAILTAVTTTAFVFFVFGFSSFKGIAELGMLCGLGMLINLAAMLLVFPSLLLGMINLGMLRPAYHTWRSARRLEASLQRFYLLKGGTVLVVAFLTVLPMGWFARGVRFEQDIQGLEPKNLPPAVVNARIQDLFGKRGQKLIVVVRDRDLERALQKNDALKDELQGMVADGTIHNFDSLSFLVPSEKRQRRNLRRINGIDRERVLADLREILLNQGFRLEPFSQFFSNLREAGQRTLSVDRELPSQFLPLVSNYIRKDGDEYLIVTYVYSVRGKEFMRAYDRLSSRGGLWREGVLITGFPLVEKTFGEIVKQDFGILTGISILGVLGILLLHFRGWREITVVFVPLICAAVSFLGLIEILHVSINLFNLIIIPLIFGIGVDDHVHILHRYLEHRESDWIGKAVYRSGRAVVLTSLTTMVGFGALMASRFDGLVLLGTTALIGIGLAMLSALVVMPCLITHILRPPAKSALDTPRKS